uniref:Uncharacterized protein n=1 Tax=Ditylum brightwellii TaxID=49249 RepID=A0A7S2EU21_9STRA|mmetsp:Transcript_7189/g.10818  ORF Transcript_7189/g.10818 Transcript_7189/m.10818 type:complete len:859 (+) Transcript_7189:81-2657(+)
MRRRDGHASKNGSQDNSQDRRSSKPFSIDICNNGHNSKKRSLASMSSSNLDHDTITAPTNTSFFRSEVGGKNNEQFSNTISRKKNEVLNRMELLPKQCDGTRSIMILDMATAISSSSNLSSSTITPKYNHHPIPTAKNSVLYSSTALTNQDVMIPGIVAVCCTTTMTGKENIAENVMMNSSNEEDTAQSKPKKKARHSNDDGDDNIISKVKRETENGDYARHDDITQNEEVKERTKNENEKCCLSVYISDGHETFFGRIKPYFIKGGNLLKRTVQYSINNTENNGNYSTSSGFSSVQSCNIDNSVEDKKKIDLIRKYILQESNPTIDVSYQLRSYGNEVQKDDSYIHSDDVTMHSLQKQEKPENMRPALAKVIGKRNIYLIIREKLSNGVVRIIYSGSFYPLTDNNDNNYCKHTNYYDCQDKCDSNNNSQTCLSTNTNISSIHTSLAKRNNVKTAFTSSSTLPILNLLSDSLTNALSQISTLHSEQKALQQNLASWRDTTQKLNKTIQSEKDLQFDLFLTLHNRAKQDLRRVKHQLKDAQQRNNSLLKQHQEQLQSLIKQKKHNQDGIIDREEEHDYVSYDPKEVELLAAGPVQTTRQKESKHLSVSSITKATAIQMKKGKTAFNFSLPFSSITAKKNQHHRNQQQRNIINKKGDDDITKVNSYECNRKKNPYNNAVEVWNPQDLFPSDDDKSRTGAALIPLTGAKEDNFSFTSATTSKTKTASKKPAKNNVFSSKRKDENESSHYRELRCFTSHEDDQKRTGEKKRKHDDLGNHITQTLSKTTPISTSSSKSSLSPRRTKSAFRYDNFSDDDGSGNGGDYNSENTMKSGGNGNKADDGKSSDEENDDDGSCHSVPLL